MMATCDTLLKVRDLNGFYGESHVLHGMNFDVHSGEVVTLLGRNGAGKTTTMRAIMGLLRKRSGSIQYRAVETIGLPSNKIARLGIANCPEERGIFSALSVRENLLLPPVVLPGGLSLDEINALFPRLEERRNSQGTKLSGGEQQMLAIARILRTGYPLDRTAYRRRNVIERLFCKLKNWRRIATRYDKLAANYMAAIALVSAVIAWC